MYKDEHEDMELEAWILAKEEYPVEPWVLEERGGELWE